MYKRFQAYLLEEKGNYVLFVYLECVCAVTVSWFCVSLCRGLTAKLELGWLLLWGVNLGLGGFPASLSLCLLLFMCCRDQHKYHQRANKHLLYHSGTTSNVISWINNGYTLSMTEVHRKLHHITSYCCHTISLSGCSTNRLMSSWDKGCLYKTGGMHLRLKQPGCSHMPAYPVSFFHFHSSRGKVSKTIPSLTCSIKWTSKGEKLHSRPGLMPM